MLILSLAALLATADLPVMNYSRNGDHHVVEVGEFEAAAGQAVEADIARRASELCAGKQVSWGKFAFQEALGKVPGASPSTIKSYRREFSCAAATARPFTAAADGWAATPGDERDVRTLFSTYFAKRDSGDFSAAGAMLSPETLADPAEWSQRMRDFNRQSGKGSRRLTKITWYVNPAQADRPGVYAALDFTGTYPGLHLYCGYLMLYRRGAADYEIVREEQTSFERNAETPDANHLAAVRAASCRD